jgi:hypothetical protein
MKTAPRTWECLLKGADSCKWKQERLYSLFTTPESPRTKNGQPWNAGDDFSITQGRADCYRERKTKDDEEFSPVVVRLQQIDLGLDARTEKPVKSFVLVRPDAAIRLVDSPAIPSRPRDILETTESVERKANA